MVDDLELTARTSAPPMFIYGKTATNGIAVMSYLAAVAPRRAGSAEIARERSLSRVLTAKLLTQLSSAGLVAGHPGPGGGYTLARSADEIRLVDIVSLFSQMEESSPCPFGVGWCGNHTPCPLHESISGMKDKSRDFLEHTRLSVFQSPPAEPPPHARCAHLAVPVVATARSVSRPHFS